MSKKEKKIGKLKSKRHIGIVFGLIAVVSVAMLLIPIAFQYTKEMTIPFSAYSDVTARVTVTALDDDGNVVYIPAPAYSAFKVGEDVYISSIRVDVSWNASGIGVDWSTFNLDGAIVFSYLNEYDNWIAESSYNVDSVEQSGNDTHTFVLGVDTCKAENILYGGWFIKGAFIGTATVTDELLGTGLSAVLPEGLSGTLSVTWDADLNIVGTWDWFNT